MKIVYGHAQGRTFEVVAHGEYRGVCWEIVNNRGTYPLATIRTPNKRLRFPTNIHALDDDSVSWCYADEGYRLGDYRAGRELTVEEIVEDVKKVVDQVIDQL